MHSQVSEQLDSRDKARLLTFSGKYFQVSKELVSLTDTLDRKVRNPFSVLTQTQSMISRKYNVVISQKTGELKIRESDGYQI